MKSPKNLCDYAIMKFAIAIKQSDGKYLVGSYNKAKEKIYVCADFMTLWAFKQASPLRFHKTDAKAIKCLLDIHYTKKSDIHFIERIGKC